MPTNVYAHIKGTAQAMARTDQTHALCSLVKPFKSVISSEGEKSSVQRTLKDLSLRSR